MIVKKGFTTSEALISDVLSDLEFTGKINEDTMKRWASDRAEEIIGTEQLTYSLALLDIDNFEADIPDGLHSIYVAGSINTGHKVNREHFIGYTQKVYGTDCDVKVELLCPKCGNEGCSCSNAVIDVQVNEMYIRSRPYLWAMTSTGYLGYSAATTDGFPCTGPDSKFRLMRPFAHNDTLWNSEYYLGECNRIGDKLNGCFRYKVENGKFITDMKEGQVFLAFLKYEKDEDGYFLIPNYPVVIRAVHAYIIEKMMWKEWMRDGNQTNRLRHLDAKNESERLMAQATTELEMPSPDVLSQITQKHWQLDRSRYYY